MVGGGSASTSTTIESAIASRAPFGHCQAGLPLDVPALGLAPACASAGPAATRPAATVPLAMKPRRLTPDSESDGGRVAPVLAAMLSSLARAASGGRLVGSSMAPRA